MSAQQKQQNPYEITTDVNESCLTSPWDAYTKGLTPKVVQALEPWFSHFTQNFMHTLRRITLKKGQILVEHGSPAKFIYLLVDGNMRSTTQSSNGITYVIDDFVAPFAFGEIEILSQTASYQSQLIATSDCKLFSVTRDAYLAWLKDDSEVLFARTQKMLSVVIEQSQKERLLLSWDAQTRLAYILYKHSLVLNTSHDNVISIPFSHAELAQMCGVSVKSISRSVHALEKLGALTRKGRTITLTPAQCRQLYLMIVPEIHPR